MTPSAQLHRMNRGNHFRAFTVRTPDPTIIDPFLGVDHAWISGPTFPPHPHAGFSAVSYLFLDSNTAIVNRDSRGTRNLIQPGGLHWLAAGSGIVHEEYPAEVGKTVHMLQIFVNLPVDKQSATPFTLTLQPQEVPVVQQANARVRILLGSFDKKQSPLKTPTAVRLLDITLDANARITLPDNGSENAFVLPVSGSIMVNEVTHSADDDKIPVFPATASLAPLNIQAGATGAQFVYFSGTPLRQDVLWQGSIALASKEALAHAIAAYQRGAMGTLESERHEF